MTREEAVAYRKEQMDKVLRAMRDERGINYTVKDPPALAVQTGILDSTLLMNVQLAEIKEAIENQEPARGRIEQVLGHLDGIVNEDFYRRHQR